MRKFEPFNLCGGIRKGFRGFVRDSGVTMAHYTLGCWVVCYEPACHLFYPASQLGLDAAEYHLMPQSVKDHIRREFLSFLGYR